MATQISLNYRPLLRCNKVKSFHTQPHRTVFTWAHHNCNNWIWSHHKLLVHKLLVQQQQLFNHTRTRLQHPLYQVYQRLAAPQFHPQQPHSIQQHQQAKPINNHHHSVKTKLNKISFNQNNKILKILNFSFISKFRCELCKLCKCTKIGRCSSIHASKLSSIYSTNSRHGCFSLFKSSIHSTNRISSDQSTTINWHFLIANVFPIQIILLFLSI